MRILISGGTGFLGTKLSYELLRKGHEVFILTRQNPDSLKPSPFRFISWPVQEPRDQELLRSCEVAINLVGESIASKRWSKEQKLQIKNSRIVFTTELVDQLKQSHQLKVFLSASGTGFYGHRKTEVLNEASPRGEGFLADVCTAWEAAALQLKTPNVRTVLLRTGAVLDRGQGFLKEMEPLYQNWLGGPVGNGEQMLSWIHVQDWVRAAVFCLEQSQMVGPVNMVAPEPLSNKSISSILSGLFGQPLMIPAPRFAVKVGLGEMAVLALDSQNVRPEKLAAAGFQFLYPTFKEALYNIYDYEKSTRKMGSYFESVVWVPSTIENVFKFFTDAKNLELLTPAGLNMRMINQSTNEMSKGTLIDYQFKIHGVPAKWRALISDYQSPRRFIDEQLMGPYNLWRHTHTFESVGGGTLIGDQVRYRLPLRGLGRLFAGRMVRGDISKIFGYRKKKLVEQFKKHESQK